MPPFKHIINKVYMYVAASITVGWVLAFYRVQILRQRGWAGLGGVCDHINHYCPPHQRNVATEGIGGRCTERACVL